MKRRPRSDDPTKRELEKDLAAERAATRKADLAWLMNDARGRRVVHELLYSPLYGLGFDEAPVHTNGSLMFADAGKRAAARKFVDRLRLETPDDFLEMHREQLEAQHETRNLRALAESNPGRPAEEREE